MQTNKMRICIAGAGAIGCTLAARLGVVHGTINVFARGATLRQLQQQGITLHDLDGTHCVRVNASDDAAALGPQDLVFICTKAPALPVILEQIQPLLHEQTRVIPVINGLPWWYFHGQEGRFADSCIRAIDPHDQLSQLLPDRHLLGAVTFITAQTEAPGVVRSANPHLMILGEIDNQLSERLETARALIAAAGIESRATDNIRDQIWTKIIANLTSNPLSVLTGATLEQLYSDQRLQPLVRQVLDEVLLTAAAYGARVRFDPATIMEMGAGMGPVKTSMLQDFQRNQALELATIGDAVVELAERMGLAMKTTRHLLALTHFVSERCRAERAAA